MLKIAFEYIAIISYIQTYKLNLCIYFVNRKRTENLFTQSTYYVLSAVTLKATGRRVFPSTEEVIKDAASSLQHNLSCLELVVILSFARECNTM